MGFWDKHNPHATRRSARIWALGGGIVGFAVGLIGWLSSDMRPVALLFFLPWMTIGCGIAGAAIEWQLPPDD
jgi:hypothetical protein